MEHIYSKLLPERGDKSQLLHIIVRKEDFKKGRTNVIDPNNFLQLALLNLDNGTTFKAHKHRYNEREKEQVIAQESWVVIEGKVKVHFYDLDDKLIKTEILREGDCSITLSNAGHNYTIIKDNSKILEFKTGPYISQEVDKEFIK